MKAVAATSNIAFVAARSEVLRYSSGHYRELRSKSKRRTPSAYGRDHHLITAPSSNGGIPAVNFEALNQGRSHTDVRAKAIARLGIMAG